MSQDRANSSAENLLGDDAAAIQTESSYVNSGVSVESISIPSSPPPSYQRVLEETRLAAWGSKTPEKRSLSTVRCGSFDSQPSPNRSILTRRSNTISSHEYSSDSDEGQDRLKTNAFDADKAEYDLIGNVRVSEMSLWRDFQEPSTSCDASSAQLDDNSIATMVADERVSNENIYAGLDEYENDDEYENHDEYENDDENQFEEEDKTPVQNAKIIKVANKTSKVMYAALAKELGLSCRMSDQCRCADCQGGYLHCDPEGDSGTDGGLGAGTPMFVSEIFGHGTAPACNIL